MALPIIDTGWVVGSIFHSEADDSDPDRKAQVAVNVGTIKFTPATGYHLASPVQAITHGPISASLDSQGDIHPLRTSNYETGSDTEDGVSLPIGVYNVTYSLQKGSLPSHQIVVKTEHTTESPLSLFASMNEPAIPLTPGIGMSDAEILTALEGI